MTKTKYKYDDDHQLVIVTLSRGDVRTLCGDAVADRLSDEDMERLAHEMNEACSGDSFAEDLQHIIADKFSESSEDEEE
jgi:hypothetical protein